MKKKYFSMQLQWMENDYFNLQEGHKSNVQLNWNKCV